MNRVRVPFAAMVSLVACVALAQSPPSSPEFYKTTNSDQWVAHSITLQQTYSRVLLVDASDRPPHTIRVAPLSLNAANASFAPRSHKYHVAAVFHTLQEAADAARGGDLVAVMPGTYAGFVLQDNPSAGDGHYIHFKAMGDPGDVVIDRASSNPDWMILLRATHHVIIQGFNLAGHNTPAIDPASPRAGIMLDGDFGSTGKQTHHVVLIGNFSHNHRKWGFHSRDTHTVLMQDNVFALSAMEHSAYVSDGSDNYVIRRNIFFGSHAGGLQCNLDTVSSFHDLVRNHELREYPKEEPTREWAVGLVTLATQKFGENNFPDGKGINFIIEDNVINENGKGGGGSLNLAGLQDSLIQNNLIYGNYNHGIAQWGDANPYDRSSVKALNFSTVSVQNERDLPLWGCRRNLVRNNTVLMNNRERAAMQCVDGSWGTKLYNNIFINDVPFSIEVDRSSTYQHRETENVANTVSIPKPDHGLVDDSKTSLDVTQTKAAAEFVRSSDEPWIIVEGKWWRLNPNRPDFRPVAKSSMLNRRGDTTQMPQADLSGAKRTVPSIGAFAAELPGTTR